MRKFEIIFKGLNRSAILLLSIGCSVLNEDLNIDQNLNEYVVPDAKITLSEEIGKVDVALGLVNNSDQTYPEIDNCDGSWVLLNSKN